MGKKKNATWAEAKKRCRLNQADIQMAKELGMTPKSLLKNIPSPSQQWKAPVKVWVRDLYEKKFGKQLSIEHSNQPQDRKKKGNQSEKTSRIPDEDLPF
ncbi:hypothetical protein HUG15_06435 [Salicibibacter cibarius]|uniref:Uncharacterized protein n=1 Tax=Salicibibacter cibarius TaxID=2743000 RepID=A0A7T6Z213_9BACI|nr:hypothetical protein [Salicibibacter cibarius]QQK75261.1 hypothetical protein HUG15_06435 [Salicibibacter cibarius]